jgi:hypothetical protein
MLLVYAQLRRLLCVGMSHTFQQPGFSLGNTLVTDRLIPQLRRPGVCGHGVQLVRTQIPAFGERRQVQFAQMRQFNWQRRCCAGRCT